MFGTMRRWSFTLGIAVATAACGDPVSSGDPLTEGEMTAISGMLASSGVDGVEGGLDSGSASPVGLSLSTVTADPTVSADLIEFSQSVSYTGTCAGGGSVTVQGNVSGAYDSDTESGSFSVDVDARLSACQALHEGVTFTVDADVELEGTLEFESGLLVGDNVFTYQGHFEWTSDDGRAGSCKIDLTLTLSPEGATSVSGSVCGQTVHTVA